MLFLIMTTELIIDKVKKSLMTRSFIFYQKVSQHMFMFPPLYMNKYRRLLMYEPYIYEYLQSWGEVPHSM